MWKMDRNFTELYIIRMMETIRDLFWAIFVLLAVFCAGCNKEQQEIPFEPFVWDSSPPEEQGMNPEILDSAFILASQYGFIDGMLVIRNGKIVAEAYYNGFTSETPHYIMSVSKSMLSAITGLVLYGDYGVDLEDRMLDYFPQYVTGGLDPRKQDITIEHPLVSDPGEVMRYNTFITHLLSGVITKAAGQGTDEFGKKFLFAPMGIDIDYWEKNPQGICFGRNSMHVTPREMAVLGLLYLQNGVLNGEQIIPEAWVEYSLSPSTNLIHPNEWGSWKNYNYACLWWLGQFSDVDSFMGYGYGGQFVIVFPSLNLIVVTTAKNDVPPETTNTQEWAIFDIVNEYILASIY